MAPVTFKTQVVDTLNELRKRNIVSPLPEPDLAEPEKTLTAVLPPPVEKTPEPPVPHWVCKVCGNPNHLSRQFCFMQVCAAPRGFPGPYMKAVRDLPPPDQKTKPRKSDAFEHAAVPRILRAPMPTVGGSVYAADAISHVADPRFMVIQAEPPCVPTFLPTSTPPPPRPVPGALPAPVEYLPRQMAPPPGAVPLHPGNAGVMYTVPYPMAPPVAAYPPSLHPHAAAYGVPHHMVTALHAPPAPPVAPTHPMPPGLGVAYFAAPPVPEMAYYAR